jgi:hypothetical protein
VAFPNSAIVRPATARDLDRLLALVQLQSATQRVEAHRFYADFGFAPSSVGFRLYLD